MLTMREYILQTRSYSSRIVTLAAALLVCAGCSRSMRVNSATTVNESPQEHACLEIVGRSLKGTTKDGDAYRFREELRYEVRGTECDRGLWVTKTICVGGDCKTTPRHKIGRKSPMKMSFMVNKAKMDERFTIITDVLLKDSKIRTYGYEFYPRRCVEKPCTD